MATKFFACLGMTAIAATLASCGETRHKATTGPSPTLQTPVLSANDSIPTRYTCNIHRMWLPLHWGAIPPSAVELVLLITTSSLPIYHPDHTVSNKLIAAYMIVGLKPTSHGLQVGKLPNGALVGTSEFLPACPSGHHGEKLLFRLYALSKAQRIDRTSSPVEAYKKIVAEEPSHGLFIASYGST
jgi:hypothetical protein